jgi:lipid-binding SYLF domain-containing protein
MKKLRLFLLSVLTAAAAFGADTVLARAEYVKRIESCEAVLRELQMNPATAIPADILAQARGLVITNQVRAGIILGVKDGYGVVMVKRPSGQWSVPAFLKAGEASIGLQLGASAVETVYVIMDDATPRLLYNQRFNIGADAKAIAGPRVAERENNRQPLIAAPVLVYTRNMGLFAGATVKAGYLTRDDTANRSFYSTTYTLPEILYSDCITPSAEVQPLMAYVQQIAP